MAGDDAPLSTAGSNSPSQPDLLHQAEKSRTIDITIAPSAVDNNPALADSMLGCRPERTTNCIRCFRARMAAVALN